MKTGIHWSTLITLILTVLAMGCGSSDNETTTNTGGGTPSSGDNTNTTAAQNVTVPIPTGATGKGSAAYGTNPLVIPQGSTVTWVNQDAMPHTATSTTGVFDSGTLQTGQQFSHTFNDPGTFPYFCAIHGQASMNGEIQVTPGATPSPTATSTGMTTPTPSPTATPTSTPTGTPTPTPTPTMTMGPY
jgi:plastocyanin